MKQFLREHIALVTALFLPVLLIIGVLLAIYLPQLLVAAPAYDVVYRYHDSDAECGFRYDVESGRLQADKANRRRGVEPEPCSDAEYEHDTFYIYDPTTDEHTKVAFSEVVDRTLESSRRAPDGYRINTSRYHSGRFLFFDSGRDEGWEMTKDGASHVMTFDHLGSYPRPDFVGWVVEE